MEKGNEGGEEGEEEGNKLNRLSWQKKVQHQHASLGCSDSLLSLALPDAPTLSPPFSSALLIYDSLQQSQHPKPSERKAESTSQTLQIKPQIEGGGGELQGAKIPNRNRALVTLKNNRHFKGNKSHMSRE